ncbi:hypothetical protein PHA77_19050 (plasmid) [Edwardsiella tarda]|uniref:hypothetical protein n=1 Tax=Edwardsiella tarda TaxID=636 RepID=UPI00244405D9|nr:hypothetical protein [Edwardsiella tarda]WGE31143.1 hypothetical protein PHA77_19050 [Edwardsiella tarda]
MKIGLYCTVSKREFHLALTTLSFAGLSDYVFRIVILITDEESDVSRKITEKITVYSQNFGSGYSRAVADGGYDQIAARNFLIEKLSATDTDWLLMHDADDIYDLDYYRFISEECRKADAVTCSCFSLRAGNEVCVPLEKTWNIKDRILYNPHTRIWKKTLNLRYKKSVDIENFFVNHSRHCGVVFPEHMNIIVTDGLYHFHLHALLNKRHSKKILAYSNYNCILPKRINDFLEENDGFFINHGQEHYV